MKRDVIVIGGGAAGLMCAIEAGKRGRSVLVLEHAERLGKKILISGGGRCNFTNLNAGPENYLSGQPALLQIRAGPLSRRRISSRSSRSTASPTTKKNWASFFATSARARSWKCCKRNATPRAWKSGSTAG